jgi:hypothetical protein
LGWQSRLGVLAANAKEAEEAADRKQKRQDRQPEREDAHSGSGDDTSMTQPGSGASAARSTGSRKALGGGSPGRIPTADIRGEIQHHAP